MTTEQREELDCRNILGLSIKLQRFQFRLDLVPLTKELLQLPSEQVRFEDPRDAEEVIIKTQKLIDKSK